jgi:DNA invertase Pin-like site-specific DNA recombinase
MASTDLKRLRKMIDSRRSAGGRVAASARADIVAGIERAHAGGASYTALASALGLKLQTLSRWLEKRPSAKLVAVRVPLSAAGLTLHAPHGVRIDGLSLDDIAELLKRLV